MRQQHKIQQKNRHSFIHMNVFIEFCRNVMKHLKMFVADSKIIFEKFHFFSHLVSVGDNVVLRHPKLRYVSQQYAFEEVTTTG